MSLIDMEIEQIIREAESNKSNTFIREAEIIRIERKAYEDIKGLITEVKELCNGRERTVRR